MDITPNSAIFATQEHGHSRPFENINHLIGIKSEKGQLPYAGIIKPKEAWHLFSNGLAVLVDVRTKEELQFVGRVPGSIHVAWATGTSMTHNPRFVRELEAKLNKQQLILLLCRSGKRSALAAQAATKAGFNHVFNIEFGFEGELDSSQHRRNLGGWCHENLPWIQD